MEVDRVKQHKEPKVEYMTLMMELKQQRREGVQEGLREKTARVVVNLLKKKFPYDEISELAETTRDEVVRIAEENGLACH